ncbi:hypothetical protein GOBAR_AA04070 [Gossypium barbadense]|uniref:SWIM-type domain-containing protein n=1 Tax=Gossypium barbadense TaxID=3634 RepID=A0A2P5YLQ2_GOSBA|nr:hypothetical protein GOBAR_AA04070 [Gossypium barbadense]
MELVDDEDVETMIALYCGNESDKNSPIHLFAELAGMEQNEDLTAYGEEHATEEPCMVAPISYVDSELTIHRINIDLNVTPDIDVVGDDGYDNSDHCDEEVDSDSDPDVDDMRRIVIHNNPGPHMSLIDPDAAHEAEFPEYPEILPAHRLAVNSDHGELLCLNRHYILESVGSRRKVVIGMYELHLFKNRRCGRYANLLGLTRAHQYARFQYRVSYRKAWIAKQMAMEQLYGDFDASYNELQGWIVAMREYRTSWSHIFFAKEWLYLRVIWRVKRTHLSNSGWVLWSRGNGLKVLMRAFVLQQVNQIEAGYVFVEDVWDAMVANHRMARSMNIEIYSRRHETFRVTKTIGCRPGIPSRSYGVDLRNRWCDYRRFQTLHYPCAHVVAACAKVNLNVEQFVDDVYTLERTLRVWENEFPILPDLSTREVPPTTFELVPNRGLRRNPRGRPQLSRIRNEMDIREKSDGKRCRLCRLASHNRSKCP